MKRNLSTLACMPTIKEADEYYPLTLKGNKFSYNSSRETTYQKSEASISPFDAALLNRSTEDILSDFHKNPFFRAKLNYLLKGLIISPSRLTLREND